jgi:gliding motility-associated-like protein
MNSKTWLLFINICLVSFVCFPQNTFVPDNNFEQALIDIGLDTAPLDNFVPTANISGIINLDVAGKNILDLTGIEDFLLLEKLDCSNNQLTQLNITQNINLDEIYCNNNQLTSLVVSPFTSLVRLWCFSNQLQNLDVTQNTRLASLRCEDNNLSSLNTSTLVDLNVLTCEQNQITNLDTSNNTALRRFHCGNNLLSELNLSNNSNLTYLSCIQGQLTTLNLSQNGGIQVLLCSNNQLRALDLSQNTSLTDLDCSNNQLCRLKINNGNNFKVTLMNFSGNADLNCVVVDNTNDDHSIWEPNAFTNYVDSEEGCNNLVPVDALNDFIGTQYTLPVINNGNFFSESNGNGELLNSGDIITNSKTIYVFNSINCYSNESNFNVIISDNNYLIPKFFTPNNDGNNDNWQVLDNSNSINNISIYNRYGKLVKFLLPNTPGWDGNFNGKPMNTDSYWYEIVLNTNEILRGYFTLKR